MSPRRTKRTDHPGAGPVPPDQPITDPADGPGAARPEPTRRQRRADRKRGDALAAAALSGGATGAQAAAGPAKGGRAFRFPALLVIIGLLVAGVVLQGRLTTPTAPVTASDDLGRALPTADPAGSLGSTWFCAAGTAYGTQTPTPPARAAGPPSTTTSSSTTSTTRPRAPGTTPGTTAGTTPRPPGTVVGAADDTPPVFVVAEHTVIVANAGDQPQQVAVTVYPSEGAPATRQLTVVGHSRSDLTLSDVVKAPFASATVEATGGLISVQHRLLGPNGRVVSACASAPASNWYFPAGTTRPGTRQVFIAFNPFPERAVLDFAFQVEDESGNQAPRESNKLIGKVVPANSVVAIDITDIITVSPQVATVVRTRAGQGRVIVDQLLVSDGTNNQPKSLAVTLGAPVPQPSWLFADGPRLEAGVTTAYVVQNPSTDTIQADLVVQPDAQAVGAEVVPVTVTVRPGGTATVPVTKDTPGATNAGYWVAVQSRNAAPIVVERVVRADAPAARVGSASTMGSPVVAGRWIVPAAGGTGQKAGEIVITNFSPSSAVVLTVAVAGGGGTSVLPAFDRVELAAGRRTIVDLASLTGADGADSRLLVTVDASGPVVTEQVAGFVDPATISDLVSVPVRDTVAAPPADLAIDTGAPAPPTIPGTGTVAPATVPPLVTTTPPGTDPSGSEVPTTVAGAGEPGGASSTTTTLDPAAAVTTSAPASPG